MGSLIVFEGPDGAGKTTLVARYADWRRKRSSRVTTLSFPGREPHSLGRLVYDIHHDPVRFDVAAVTPESLQALHVAAHLDAIDRYIRPLVAQGETVLLDRYWWSTWVYGIDGLANRATINALVDCERAHWGALKPDVVVLITRRDSLRAEDAGPQWSRRMELYHTLAEREQAHYPVEIVPNDATEEDALKHLVDVLDGAQRVRGPARAHYGGPQL